MQSTLPEWRSRIPAILLQKQRPVAGVADSGSRGHRPRLHRSLFVISGIWCGWNAPDPMICYRSNLVPLDSAQTVATKTPFGS
jgi:hypothetical protein